RSATCILTLHDALPIFEELCEFVEEMRFERVGVFQFSREEGTPSYDLDGQLPARVKARRQKKVLGIQRNISKAYQTALVGKTLRSEEHTFELQSLRHLV